MDAGNAFTAARSARAYAPVREKSTPEDQNLHLHYTQPSKLWSEALPVGNGRLGAMVHGRTTTELLQLNEDSVWYGGPQDRTPRDAYRNLPLLRQLIREGRHAEAEELVRTAFFASPASMRHYEPLGNCYLDFGHENISGYRSACYKLVPTLIKLEFRVGMTLKGPPETMRLTALLTEC